MARKPARTASHTLDEKGLTKGELRKLNALRKSVGEEIGTTTFVKWLVAQATDPNEPVDKNAEQIASTLEPLVQAKKLSIRRGGYLVKRGRGRVIVTRADI